MSAHTSNSRGRRSVARRFFGSGIALVVAVGVVSGCGEDSSGSGDESSSSQLSIAIGAGPQNMDYVIKTDPQRDRFGFQNVYQTLAEHETGTDELVPLLATEWTNDGTEWTFTLRDDVTFSNGEKFDADDVVATVKTILDEASGAEENRGTISLVTDVAAADEYTVVFTTSAPDPALPSELTKIAIAPADSTPEERAEKLIGTGPYEQVSWDKDDNITFKARDDYWGDEPAWQEVTVVFRPEASVRLAALSSDEVDIALDLPPELATSAPQVISAPQALSTLLRVNSLQGPLQDLRLREALNYAIDRESLVENVYGGFAVMPQAQIMVNTALGFNSDLEDFPYDPDKARELVQEVGGDPTLTFSGTTGRSLKDRDAAEAVIAMLEDVGFTVKAEFPSIDAYVEQIVGAAPGGPDLMYSSHGNEILDPSFTAGAYFQCDGVVSRWCDPSTDELITSANSELDPDARAGIYEELWQSMKDNATMVALANLKSVSGGVDGITWTPRPDAFTPFDDIGRS